MSTTSCASAIRDRNRGTWRYCGAALAVTAALLLGVPPAAAQDAARFFRQNCAACHTIGGGPLTGPDLKDVHQRQQRDWPKAFILNPKAKLDGGDAYAAKLLGEARGVVMPNVAGLTPDLVDQLLNLIEAESALEKSHFMGPQISNKPFTPADVAQGYALFTGGKPFAEGAPACIACHSLPDLPGLGGGKLGPDLTRVFERLQGRIGLSAWLNAPATVTMQSAVGPTPLAPEEIFALVALFQDRAQQTPDTSAAALFNFSLLGLGGAGLLLVLFDVIWRRRFRGVRRPLVQPKSLRGQS